MNHKRRRCKNRRAGCLMCKPWKVNGSKRKDADPQQLRLDERAAQEKGE